tara:strand:+ start:87 stop:269 length:183 start_codon:yes stop_codon:yes gene_type:complete
VEIFKVKVFLVSIFHALLMGHVVLKVLLVSIWMKNLAIVLVETLKLVKFVKTHLVLAHAV